MGKLLTVILLAMALPAAANPLTDMQIQRELVAWHTSQGSTPEQTCAVITSYFPSVKCWPVDGSLLISRGSGLVMTYFVEIPIKGVKP